MSTFIKFAAAAAVAATAVVGVVAYKRYTVNPVRARADKLENRLMALNERRLKTTDAQQLEAIENEMAIVAWDLGQAYGELLCAEAKQAA